MNITDVIAQAIQEMLDEHDGTARINRNEFASVEGYLSQAANAPFKSPFAKHSLTLLHKGFGARRP